MELGTRRERGGEGGRGGLPCFEGKSRKIISSKFTFDKIIFPYRKEAPRKPNSSPRKSEI
jgi:hypothetical protein